MMEWIFKICRLLSSLPKSKAVLKHRTNKCSNQTLFHQYFFLLLKNFLLHWGNDVSSCKEKTIYPSTPSVLTRLCRRSLAQKYDVFKWRNNSYKLRVIYKQCVAQLLRWLTKFKKNWILYSIWFKKIQRIEKCSLYVPSSLPASWYTEMTSWKGGKFRESSRGQSSYALFFSYFRFCSR